MLYQNTGEKFAMEGKTFTIGGEVFANGRSDYWGLFGTVTEIRTGADRETDPTPVLPGNAEAEVTGA